MEPTLSNSVANTDETENALEYLLFKSKQLPILAQLACKYLTNLATSAPSERVFPDASNIEMGKRYNMIEDILSSYVLERLGFKDEKIKFIINK